MHATAGMLSAERIGALVPEGYAPYRRLVAESLVFFVSRLPGARLAEVMADQAALPAKADAATRLFHLLHRCPALHKLGQVLARRRELDEGLRRQLQRLETMEPRTPIEQVRPLVLAELGLAVERFGIRLARRPLAEASVAVVLPFTWREEGSDRHGVLKVLRPRARQHLEEDLGILAEVADHMDTPWRGRDLPPLDYRGTFEDVRRLLLHEINLGREQANLGRAWRQYAGRADVHVPCLLPFSTPNMTAMERLFGQKLTEREGRIVGGRLARIAGEALVGEALFSRHDRALFHGDPHAGNLMATVDGRLGILDWSLAGELARAGRVALARTLVGAMSLDGPQMERAITELARPGSVAMVEGLVLRAMGWLRGGAVPTPRWLIGLLDEAARMGLKFGADLMLFRKAYYTLEGVVADLCGRCDLEETLMAAMLAELAGEMPRRMVSPPWWRGFATSLSSAELFQVAMSLPALMARLAAGALAARPGPIIPRRGADRASRAAP